MNLKLTTMNTTIQLNTLKTYLKSRYNESATSNKAEAAVYAKIYKDFFHEDIVNFKIGRLSSDASEAFLQTISYIMTGEMNPKNPSVTMNTQITNTRMA